MWPPDCPECEIPLDRGVAGESRCENVTSSRLLSRTDHKSRSVSRTIWYGLVVSTKDESVC